MELDVEEEALSTTLDELDQWPEIGSVELVTQAEALSEFEEASGFGDVLQGLDANPLPAVFLVSPESPNPDLAKELLLKLQGLENVSEAILDLEWLQRLQGFLDLARRAVILLATLLCAGVVLVVGNTVRLEIENRRSEIVVVKLVGGTDSYVSRPFLYTGLWYGVGGGIIACLIVLATWLALLGPVSTISGLYDHSFQLIGIRVSDLLTVLAGSGLLGWLGARISVYGHLKSVEPK